MSETICFACGNSVLHGRCSACGLYQPPASSSVVQPMPAQPVPAIRARLILTSTFLPKVPMAQRLIADLAETFVALRDNFYVPGQDPLKQEAWERADEAIARLLSVVEDDHPEPTPSPPPPWSGSSTS